MKPAPFSTSADENDDIEKLASCAFALRRRAGGSSSRAARWVASRFSPPRRAATAGARRRRSSPGARVQRGFSVGASRAARGHDRAREPGDGAADLPQRDALRGNDQLERRVREDPDGFDDEVRRALAMPDPEDARLRPSEASGVASDDDDVSFLSPPRDASSASSAKGDPNLRTSASSHDRDRAPDHFEATLALAKALRDRGAIRDRAKGARVHARCFDGAAFRAATRAAFFADQRLTTTTKSSDASREETNRDRIDRIVSARCASLLATGTVVRVRAPGPSSVGPSSVGVLESVG